MVAHLILGPVPAYMVRNVGPRAKAVYLGTLDEEQLFVGAPLRIKDGKRVLLNDAESMAVGLVRAARLSFGKTQDTEVIVVADGASNSDLLEEHESVQSLAYDGRLHMEAATRVGLSPIPLAGQALTNGCSATLRTHRGCYVC